VAPSLNFHLAQSRIIARYYANPSRNIQYFKDVIDKQKYEFKQAAEYGLALSYFGDEQYKKAAEIIENLLAKSPNNLFYLDTFTDVSIELKQYQRAIDTLQAQVVNAPHNQVLTLNLANVMIKHQQAAQAIEILKDFLLVTPDHLLATELLSDAYRENQQKLEMHQTKAEIYALVAAYPRAIDELQTAYTFATDRKIEKQRIRARIDQFREAQRKLQTL
jgi:predicted Zn-dependent protease